jgi:hypothetical protein
MATFWGVDSATPSNNNVQGQTLFDFITQQAGQSPAFWGRYIGGNFALTAGEAQFLHDRNCKILVIYNGAHNNPNSVQGGFQEGVTDANKAIAAAQALGVPNGTWIYADIEAGWSPTADWFKGWSDTMFNSQYGGAGGVYCNPLPGNAAHFSDPYCDAFNNDPNMQGAGDSAALIYSCQHEPGCSTAANAPTFNPAVPPCNPNAAIWQYAESCFQGLVDEDLANDVGFASMW